MGENQGFLMTCGYCGEHFSGDTGPEVDVVCPQCGVGVSCKHGMLVHPVNKPLSLGRAKEIISVLGWPGFVRVFPGMSEDHPELRPTK